MVAAAAAAVAVSWCGSSSRPQSALRHTSFLVAATIRGVLEKRNRRMEVGSGIPRDGVTHLSSPELAPVLPALPSYTAIFAASSTPSGNQSGRMRNVLVHVA